MVLCQIDDTDCNTHQGGGHLFGHGVDQSLGHFTRRIHTFLKNPTGQRSRLFLYDLTSESIGRRASHLSAPPQEAEQVSVLQLLHHRHQRSSQGNHTQKLRQEGMRAQLGQEGGEAQEAVAFGGVGVVFRKENVLDQITFWRPL